jgi:hypothetical protein
MNHADADKADELDRLLNDPEVALDPGRIWQILADLSSRGNAAAQAHAGDRRGAD